MVGYQDYHVEVAPLYFVFCICTLHVSPVVNGNILDIISVGIERCQLGFNLCIAQAMRFTHGFDA